MRVRAQRQRAGTKTSRRLDLDEEKTELNEGLDEEKANPRNN